MMQPFAFKFRNLDEALSLLNLLKVRLSEEMPEMERDLLADIVRDLGLWIARNTPVFDDPDIPF